MLTVTDKVGIDFIPIFDTGFGCDLAEGELGDKIISEFEERNAELIDGRWLDGWERFCHSDIMPNYLNVARHVADHPEKDEHFAHYIDCEAHLDVFHTLFKTWNHTNEL
jgi:hypothetical protein